MYSTSDVLASVRRRQNLVSSMRWRGLSISSRLVRQHPLPHTSVHSWSDSAESHVGTCTPLVTWLMGTSSDGQRGKSDWKSLRLTAPCSRLTPLTAPLPRIAR